MSRFTTRFAALFEQGDGSAWQARHGIDAATYQQTFDAGAQGFRLTDVCGYSEGRGRASTRSGNARRPGLAGAAWTDLEQYQATFDALVQQGFRLTCVSGYAENGEARYAAIWEQRGGPDWQARHGLSRASTSRRSTRWPPTASCRAGLRLPRQCRRAVRRDLGEAPGVAWAAGTA